MKWTTCNKSNTSCKKERASGTSKARNMEHREPRGSSSDDPSSSATPSRIRRSSWSRRKRIRLNCRVGELIPNYGQKRSPSHSNGFFRSSQRTILMSNSLQLWLDPTRHKQMKSDSLKSKINPWPLKIRANLPLLHPIFPVKTKVPTSAETPPSDMHLPTERTDTSKIVSSSTSKSHNSLTK